MTTTYCVFGLGMMGTAISYDLASHDLNSQIICVEYSQDRINEVSQFLSKYNDMIEFHNLQLGRDEDAIIELLKKADIAFGAIDYKFNLELTELCIRSKTHFLDLGGNPDVVSRQHELSNRAKDAGIIIIPDCGLAPGMANILAAHLIDEFDTADEAHIRVGGLPQEPEGILKYQQVFSIRGLTNEYIEDAIIIRDGKITSVKSLTEVETLRFPQPYDDLEAFHTAGGTSSLPRLYEGKINQLTYKTIRYTGHVQYFQFLSDLGMLSDEQLQGCDLSPRQIIEKQLVNHLPKNQPDVVLVRVFACGYKDDNYIQKSIDLIDFYDTKTGFSAMARTTAYPISIIGQLISHGIIQERGVFGGEQVVPIENFIEELGKRQIIFNETTD